MRLGFIAALPEEARTLTVVGSGGCAGGNHLIDTCGVGHANAGAGAQRLVQRGVDGLVSWGTAGALAPDYTPGTLVVFESVVNASGIRYLSDARWREAMLMSLTALNAVAGHGYTSAHAAAGAATKAAIRERTGCAAVDMESAAVAAAADTAGIPFIALRVIVDPADFHIPQCALDAIDADGRTHVTAVVSSLARRPRELPSLLRLGRWYHHALVRLRLAAVALQPDFGALVTVR